MKKLESLKDNLFSPNLYNHLRGGGGLSSITTLSSQNRHDIDKLAPKPSPNSSVMSYCGPDPCDSDMDY